MNLMIKALNFNGHQHFVLVSPVFWFEWIIDRGNKVNDSQIKLMRYGRIGKPLNSMYHPERA